MAYFLSLEVSKSTHKILLSQRKYAQDLIKLMNLIYQKIVATPMELSVQYDNDGGDLLTERHTISLSCREFGIFNYDSA